MAKNLSRSRKVTDKNDPVNIEIIQLLSVNPKAKKEIANQCGVELSYVHRMYQMHFQGKASLKEYDALINNDVNIISKKPVNQIVPNDLPQEEQKAVETPAEEPVHKKSTKKLDDELVLNMLEFIQDHPEAEMAEVANKFGVSSSSIRRKCNEFGFAAPYERKRKIIIVGGDNMGKSRRKRNNIIRQQQMSIEELVDEATRKAAEPDHQPEPEPVVEEVNEVPKEQPQENTQVAEVAEADSKFKKMRYESAVSCALILDRHLMPVDKGIFENEIPKDKLFDYDWYDRIVRNWINHNVPQDEKGNWLKPLSVYITGLPAATASVIKVCNDMKLNLHLMHYNYDKESYEKQIIFDSFPSKRSDETGLGACFDGDTINLYQTSIEKLETMDIFYCISKKEAVPGLTRFNTIEHYVVETFDDIWKVFPELVIDIQKDKSKKIALFCNEVVRKDNGEYFFRKTITKSWNYSLAD